MRHQLDALAGRRVGQVAVASDTGIQLGIVETGAVEERRFQIDPDPVEYIAQRWVPFRRQLIPERELEA